MSSQIVSSSSSANSIGSRANISFETISKNSAYFDLLIDVFKKKIEPLYGDQSSVINMIKHDDGRRAEILLDGKEPVGLLVYRDELRSINSLKNLEITVLTVLDKTFEDKGYEQLLLERAAEKGNRRRADEIHIYVEKTMAAVFNFFKKNMFSFEETQNQYFMHRSLPLAEHSSMKRKIDKIGQGISTELGEKSRRTNEGAFVREERNSEEKKSELGDVSTNDKGRFDQRERVRILPSVSNHSQPVRLHQITLPKKYIGYIRSGMKPVEGRIFKGFVNNLIQGQRIRFFYTQNPQDDVTCKITKIEKYSSFPEMVKACGYKKCVPDALSEEAAIEAYHKIPGYLQNSKTYGVAAIHLEVIFPPKGG